MTISKTSILRKLRLKTNLTQTPLIVLNMVTHKIPASVIRQFSKHPQWVKVVNAASKGGFTALSYAYAKMTPTNVHIDYYKSVIDVLIECGASCKKGAPIVWAGRVGSIEVERLIERGADPCQRSYNGFTMLGNALRKGDTCTNNILDCFDQTDIRKILATPGRYGYLPLQQAIQIRRSFETINRIIDVGAEVDAIRHHKTALMIELDNPKYPRKNVVCCLLDNGADVTIKNSLGYSSIHIAMKRGFVHILDEMFAVCDDYSIPLNIEDIRDGCKSKVMSIFLKHAMDFPSALFPIVQEIVSFIPLGDEVF